jgi:tetratricopeptide (TPR) repeat protein
MAAVVSARPQPARIGLSVIVVPMERDAAELRSRMREGASFEALAVANSVDSSASRAGYIGFVEESGLRPEYRVALRGIKAGEVSAVTRVGDTFVLLKRTTEAEDFWRSTQDRALTALQQGQYPEAASLFLAAVDQAAKLGKEDIRLAESLNGLAQIYRYQQNYANAEPRARQSLAILERALGNAHDALIPSLLNLASIARTKGKYAEAEQVYRRILAIRWGTPSADSIGADEVLDNFAEVLSLVHTRDFRLEKALDTFWRSLSRSRLKSDAFLGMRDKLIAVQLLPEAESLMQRAVHLNPDSRQLRYELGEVYATWGKYEKAIGLFEEAVRLGNIPDPAVDRAQRGRIYGRIGEMNFFLVRFEDAIKALTTALELDPSNAMSRLLLASVLMRRNRLDEASVEFNRVIGANPRSAPAYDGLAQVQLSLGHYAEAELQAEKALAIDPGLQTSQYNRAMALIRDGREEGDQALAEFHKNADALQAAELRRNAIADLDRTASGLLSENRSQKAIEVLREGTRTYPLLAVFHLKLGLVQSQLQLHQDAVETFENMVQLKLDDFLVHRQLAREYQLLGNHESAQQQRVLYLQRYDAALLSNLKP